MRIAKACVIAVFSCVALCQFTVMAAESAESDFAVKTNGIRVVTAEDSDETRAFNQQSPGVTVSLLVNAPKGGIIEFDQASSAISKFLDDKGNDLLSKPSTQKGFIQTGFSPFPKIATGGKSCVVEVNAPNLPAKGTTHLKLEGVMTLLTATKTNEHVLKDVALAKDSKITAPKLELTVSRAGKPDWGSDPLELTLRSSSDLDEVSAIRFYKADGTEIKSKRTTTSRMEVLGSRTIEWTYSLGEKVDSATVKIFIWSDLQRQKVPFSMDLSLGL